MALEEVAEFFSRIIKECGSEYAVIGSVASGYFGRPRATADIDAIVLMSEDKVPEFLDCIEENGLLITRKKSVLEKLQNGKAAKIIWDKKFSIDLRLASFEIDMMAIKDSLVVKIYGVNLFVARAEELIVYKLARFSGIDQSDIRSIIKSQQKKLKWSKIENLAHGLHSQLGASSSILDRLDEIASWRKE